MATTVTGDTRTGSTLQPQVIVPLLPNTSTPTNCNSFDLTSLATSLIDVDDPYIQIQVSSYIKQALTLVEPIPSLSLDETRDRLKAHIPRVVTLMQRDFVESGDIVIPLVEEILKWPECRHGDCMTLEGERQLFYHRAEMRLSIYRGELWWWLDTVGKQKLKTGCVPFTFDIWKIVDLADQLPPNVSIGKRSYQDRSRHQILEKGVIIYWNEDIALSDEERHIIMLYEDGAYSTTLDHDDVVAFTRQIQRHCRINDQFLRV